MKIQGQVTSHEICPCCATHFGYDDATRSHDELRHDWIKAGMKWWSDAQLPPSGWNPVEQLQRAGLGAQ